MPNARVGGRFMNSRVSGTPVNARVSSFQTGILTSGVVHQLGSPLGLLLALTYSVDTSDPAEFRGDFRPNARIESN